MKKLQNIPALIFTITFLVILISRLGRAETVDIAAYGLAVLGLLTMFIASNVKSKNNK